MRSTRTSTSSRLLDAPDGPAIIIASAGLLEPPIVYLDLIVPKRLTSPNETRGHHWTTRHRETKAWERELMVLRPSRWNLILKTETRRDRRGKYRIHEERKPSRRRVTIVRCLPGRRNFCKDADNLMYTAKPLRDALKRLGLIYDDSMAWLDSYVRDAVSPDGTDYTVIRIEQLA